MKCPEFRQEIVHVLLRQASPELVARCREHVQFCADCRAESESIAATLGGLRALAQQPVAHSFRDQVRERIAREIKEEQELLDDASFMERAQATAAFALYRVRQSRGLQAFAAVAAALLVVVTWKLLSEPRPRPTRGPDLTAQIEPRPTDTVTPTDPPSVRDSETNRDPSPSTPGSTPPATDQEPKVRLSDYVDLEAIDVAKAEVEEEPLPIDFGERIREDLERDNRFARARYVMRSRIVSEQRGAPTGERIAADRSALKGMRWLVDEQEPDGSWDPGVFGGDPLARVGITALVVEALTVAPSLGVPEGVERQTIAKALRFLRSSHDPRDGTYGRVVGTLDADALTLFNHALTTLVFAEQYILQNRAGENDLQDALVRLDDLAAQRRHRELAPVDATTAPWVALAFETTLASGLRPGWDLARAGADARSYVVRDLPDVDSDRYNDQMWQMVTASAIDPLFDGERDPTIGMPTLDRLVAHLRSPSLREPTKIFFAGLDLEQRGGVDRDEWRHELDDVLVASQRSDGSWTSEYTWDRVSAAGGDLYVTALHVMTLSGRHRQSH